MRKTKIRCYKTNIYHGINMYTVYYIAYDGWASHSLATCVNCAELFAIDWGNPKTKSLSIIEIADSKHCPNCAALLRIP